MRIVNDKIRDLNPASALHLTSENWQLIYSVVVVVPWSITRGATSPHAGLVTPRHRHQCGAAEPRQPAHCSFWRFLHQVRALTTSPASCRGAAGAHCAPSHRSYSEMPQRLSPLVTADVKSSIPPVHLCRHARCIAIYLYKDNHFYLRKLAELTRCFMEIYIYLYIYIYLSTGGRLRGDCIQSAPHGVGYWLGLRPHIPPHSGHHTHKCQ